MQAPPYDRQNDFAEQERLNAGGRSTVNTAQLNAELDAVGDSVNHLKFNLELIQRDDGRLRDACVDPSSLNPATIAFLGGGGFNPRGDWMAGDDFVRLDLVAFSGSNYVCLVNHHAGASFAADLAIGRWQSFTGQQVASGTAFTPSADLSSLNVQAAIEEVYAKQLANTRALLANQFGAL